MTRIGNERADIDSSNPRLNVAGVTPTSATGSARASPRQTTVTLSVLPERSMTSAANEVYDIARTRVRRAAMTGHNAGATTSPVATLLAQLLQSQARITALLQRQPDFQRTSATNFQTALDAAFPATSHTIDPNHIYITTYVNEVVDLAGDNSIPERKPLSCLTLSQALATALTSGQAPGYDAGNTRFFHGPGNAINNPDQVVQGMDGAEHVRAFVQILQNMVQQRTTSYQQSLNNFWNTPDAECHFRKNPPAVPAKSGSLSEPAPAPFYPCATTCCHARANIANEEKLYAYMQRISYVTGPNVFNKVIDDQLPEMRQVREAVKMKAHFWNFHLSSDTKNEVATWAESHLPLGQINRMGNAHTWDETRR